MDSILTSIKKLLGLEEDYIQFDNDIILYINSVLSVLSQVGIGTEGYAITDKEDVWDDFFGDQPVYEAVKSYVYMRVRLLFDPPASAHLVESLNQMIREFEWRAFVHADPVLESPVEEPL